jgi:hypothetical protein
MIRAWVRGRARDEDGSTLPLTIFFGVLALTLVLLVVAATSLYVERKRLFTLADGAALAGAESFDLRTSTVGSSGKPQPVLTSAAVREAVVDYLGNGTVDRFDRLHLEQADTLDGRSATVSLSSEWHPPVLSLFVPDGVHLEVTAVARSVFW